MNFMAIFELGISGDAVFKIVQQNHFKTSDLLRLRFTRGNDDSIKKYLATKLKSTEADNVDLRSQNQTLELNLSQTSLTNEQLMQDIAQLREDNRRVVDQLKIEE